MKKLEDLKISRPNIVLILDDQHRGDCLGLEGHKNVETPNLDWIGRSGTHFRHAYSACPVCIPARRTIFTGQKPSSHGMLMNCAATLEGPTLPDVLSKAGYQTHLVGKLHFYPPRKLHGFMSADWSDFDDFSFPEARQDDYALFLEENGVKVNNATLGHGSGINSWISRPWHLDESLHPTNYATQKAIEFLDRRDPSLPFFLNLSFIKPHQSCVPPRYYWDKYMDMDIEAPHVGDWSRVFEKPQLGTDPEPWRVYLTDKQMHQYRAGYYGSINHIDEQIGRLLYSLPENTVILFASDHGEMLGDHQWVRKRNAFEPSTRIPFLLKLPKKMEIVQEIGHDEVVELMDIMPTLLDVAGINIPETVDGKSLLPLLKNSKAGWRNYIHGECSGIPTLNSGMQYITNGDVKYIWYPGIEKEQYFDLRNDPCEMNDLSKDIERKNEIEHWRGILINEIKDREEGFVKNGKLAKLCGPTTDFLMNNKNIKMGGKNIRENSN